MKKNLPKLPNNAIIKFVKSSKIILLNSANLLAVKSDHRNYHYHLNQNKQQTNPNQPFSLLHLLDSRYKYLLTKSTLKIPLSCSKSIQKFKQLWSKSQETCFCLKKKSKKTLWFKKYTSKNWTANELKIENLDRKSTNIETDKENSPELEQTDILRKVRHKKESLKSQSTKFIMPQGSLDLNLGCQEEVQVSYLVTITILLRTISLQVMKVRQR